MSSMKIIRTRDPSGAVVSAALLDDDKAEILAGLPTTPRRTGQVIPVNGLLAPIVPPVIIGIAQNYRAHAMEMGGELPPRPVFFLKMPHCLNAPGAPIVLPRHLRSDKVDAEAELAVVIGRACRNVDPADALEYVLGYTCANDVTARDWQKEWGGGQFCRGKGFDSFCPLGPWIVTRAAIPDPHRLRVRGRLNDAVVQDSTTADLIFPIPALIAFLSGSTTLPAGTVILTGTPSGVGAARQPPRFLAPGDRYSVDIEGIGSITNPVTEEA
jgi:2-keto-4-pentenoate hydratase/2-oxohepta-3-ene-1,7-dioic acid hydratase in catechol pathway